MKATDAVVAVDAPDDAPDVVALGESMVTFLPSRPGRLADVPSFDRAIGGAESNVACGLAAAGHAVRWVSRVGADGFGDHLVETVASYGVDVSYVDRDPVRPTGVYFRTAGDRATDAHEVAYYRAGSAASAMSVADVDLAAVRAGRILHLSGITAALSEGCLGLLHELTAAAPAEGGRAVVSFDVNHRPGLWTGSGGAEVLLELARRADIVFVGEDEAELAWGVTGGPTAIREVLPEPEVLVVKQGAKGATAFVSVAARWGLVAPTRRQPQIEYSPAPLTGRFPAAPHQVTQLRAGVPQGGTGGRWGSPRSSEAESGGGTPQARASETPPPADTHGTFEPAPTVDVVANVGAGDAFAAGFLSGILRGLPVRQTLRLGHLFAAAALTTPADLAPPPARDTTDRLTGLDDAAWERLRLGPGWTQAGVAEQEVRTP
ncbi:sugar kinase [Streptomyces sp. NPDC051985]|uniref:sugar kinase n=1 Tax=Streptomyces sp. NPDC051985 TaxID=3155807 RepID=UPI00342A3544